MLLLPLRHLSFYIFREKTKRKFSILNISFLIDFLLFVLALSLLVYDFFIAKNVPDVEIVGGPCDEVQFTS